jgi:hypothetical protein
MAKRKLNTFEKQFVANRRAGKSSFTFGGKSYSTKLAAKTGGGGGKAIAKTTTTAGAPSKKIPTPTPRPDRVSTAVATPTTLPKTAPRPTPRPDKNVVDLNWRARDEAYKRKTAETATGSPSPRGSPIARATSTKDVRQKRQDQAFKTNVTGQDAFTSPIDKMIGGMQKNTPKQERINTARRTQIGPGVGQYMREGMDKLAPKQTAATTTTAKTSRLPAAVKTTPKTARVGALTVAPDKKRKTLVTVGAAGYKK